MGEKYLSDVIDYNRDIKPHNFLAIYSGVGSGKNTFIDSFYKEESCISNPKMTVLLITSRRAKVDEILDYNEFDIRGNIGRWGNLHDVKKESESEEEFREKCGKYLRIIEDTNQKHFIYQKSVVCTNAFIEGYLKYVYNPKDVTTHLWELFDMIVIDEAHSLILDSSYQSAPFHVYDLMREYLRRYKEAGTNYHMLPQCKHLILMTGTPEHLGELDFGGIEPYVIDKRAECKNVIPKNIYFLKSSMVMDHLSHSLESEERSIYFSQSITNILRFHDKISKDTNQNKIALSFTDESKRELLAEDQRKKMVDTENNIKTNGRLLADTRLFLSTERNKEGINIYDEDITNMYIESFHLGDIEQMVGRVRSGVENLYIVLSGRKKKTKEYLSDQYDEVISSLIIDKINDYWKELYTSHHEKSSSTIYKEEWSKVFIDYIESKFSYIKFSFFYCEFQYYWNHWNGNWDYGVASFWFEQGIRDKGIVKMFKERFPESKVHTYQFTGSGQANDEANKQIVLHYIANDLKIEEKYSVEQVEEHRDSLNELLGTNYKTINGIFRHYGVGYKFEHVRKNGRISHHKRKIGEKCIALIKV